MAKRVEKKKYKGYLFIPACLFIGLALGMIISKGIGAGVGALLGLGIGFLLTEIESIYMERLKIRKEE